MADQKNFQENLLHIRQKVVRMLVELDLGERTFSVDKPRTAANRGIIFVTLTIEKLRLTKNEIKEHLQTLLPEVLITYNTRSSTYTLEMSNEYILGPVARNVIFREDAEEPISSFWPPVQSTISESRPQEIVKVPTYGRRTYAKQKDRIPVVKSVPKKVAIDIPQLRAKETIHIETLFQKYLEYPDFIFPSQQANFLWNIAQAVSITAEVSIKKIFTEINKKPLKIVCAGKGSQEYANQLFAVFSELAFDAVCEKPKNDTKIVFSFSSFDRRSDKNLSFETFCKLLNR